MTKDDDDEYPIVLRTSNNVGSIYLGNRILSPNTSHVSDKSANIINVNVIQIECNVITGSYSNYRFVPGGYHLQDIGCRKRCNESFT